MLSNCMLSVNGVEVPPHHCPLVKQLLCGPPAPRIAKSTAQYNYVFVCCVAVACSYCFKSRIMHVLTGVSVQICRSFSVRFRRLDQGSVAVCKLLHHIVCTAYSASI